MIICIDVYIAGVIGYAKVVPLFFDFIQLFIRLSNASIRRFNEKYGPIRKWSFDQLFFKARCKKCKKTPLNALSIFMGTIR